MFIECTSVALYEGSWRKVKLTFNTDKISVIHEKPEDRATIITTDGSQYDVGEKYSVLKRAIGAVNLEGITN